MALLTILEVGCSPAAPCPSDTTPPAPTADPAPPVTAGPDVIRFGPSDARQVGPGATGGILDLARFGAGCNGFAVEQPSHIVVVERPAELRITAIATHDTTLAIQTPDGRALCNDDVVDFNPAISTFFAAGEYRVWVGSFRSGEALPYLLVVELRSGGGATMDI